MAFIKTEKTGIIDFISPKDDALDLELDVDTGEPKTDLDKYRETWDEQYITIKDGEQPTKFKLNFSLTAKKQMIIDNASLGGDGKKDEFGFKLGKHKYATVKCILVGIENPENLPLNAQLIFKRDKDGFVDDKLMDDLYHYGLIEDIYSFYLSRKDNPELLKKK